MGETEEFNTLTFEKKLQHLKDTQESIQLMSSWCLKQRSHHKKIVSSWLNVLKRVKIEQRLVLFYLANDVIQYSKRKNYEFVESWGLNLQKATPLVRDEKVRTKILRIFKIWEQRSVYDDEFLSDLTGLLSAGATKKTDNDDSSDFQPQQLVNKIKQCSVLEADTDMRLKNIHDSHLPLSDSDLLLASLKERRNRDDVVKELNDGIAIVEKYTNSLQKEIVAREALLALLVSANQYYSTQRGEVKVVAYAYKNFGARVRVLKRKLDDLTPSLPQRAPSPPQRDEDVPSPGPDEDLDLPNTGDHEDGDVTYNIDKTFNTSISADGSLYNLGLSSFLTTGDNPMAMFNDTNNESLLNSINASLSSSIMKTHNSSLPGLDLLTPETPTNPPPPISFYGSVDSSLSEEPEPYRPELVSANQWTSSNWSLPAVPTAVPPPVPHPAAPLHALPPSLALSMPPFDTPESPPPAPASIVEKIVYSQESSAGSDVDHRGILPPPPPPPMLPMLGPASSTRVKDSDYLDMEDVDHRLLTAVPPPVLPPNNLAQLVQDVDHRNLISLTHQPMGATIPINPHSETMQINMPRSIDQDYRVPPPMVPPPDIVESVDMDLSEDEEQYPTEHRRPSFNNNKVLTGGGSNGKTHNNLIRINSAPENEFTTPPIISQTMLPPPMNPFDSLPMSDNMKYNQLYDEKDMLYPEPEYQENEDYHANPADTVNGSFDEGSRRTEDERGPPQYNSEWQNSSPRFMNQRFPRNWAPRSGFRPRGVGPSQNQQFWPRNGPRPPVRWMGQRPPNSFW